MWLAVGFILGILVLGVSWWLKDKIRLMVWYEWLVGIVGLVLLFFTIQNYFGSVEEFQTKPAMMFLLVTGLPGLILLGVSWRLILRHKNNNV